MSRYYSLEHDTHAIPPNDTIHCHTIGCRRQVASFRNYIQKTLSGGLGLFDRLINVRVANTVKNPFGTTVARTHCRLCDKMIGWKIIAVTWPSRYIKERRFIMRLDQLSFSNNETMILPMEQQKVRAEGYGDSTGEEMSTNIDQDGGLDNDICNYLRHLLRRDQDGYLNEQIVNQVVGANEQNVDQHGGDKEQNHDIDKDGGANEQNVDKDGGANEQFLDKDGGSNNEENADQYEGSPMKRRNK
ncbi:hypothetical protein EJD97_022745 [Solanum chilense]|uniref:Yippee domain-containing protein n=1 Tax=Solanum chilense TaxID=4083 RepID=A0A6N2AT28_SOLCI|nr:hypothetical protein EJD97_022745 [Solanum chilense]